MTGNVVVTQAGHVMRGERMVANLTTGVTRVEATKGRQIEMMMQPGAKDAAPPAPAAKAAPAAKDAKASRRRPRPHRAPRRGSTEPGRHCAMPLPALGLSQARRKTTVVQHLA